MCWKKNHFVKKFSYKKNLKKKTEKMPTTCEINFENNPQKVIYAGQLLRGTVKLQLTEEKNVRGIYIRIRGRAHSHWTEGSGDNRSSYTGDEVYLDEKTFFVGGPSGELRVSPGTYIYEFQCMLPAGVPTSFEGEHGYIRYTAHVVMDIPLWPDKTFEDTFTVLKPINLNADPMLREPNIAEKNKTFFLCCLLWCCSSDPLRMTAITPVGGYTPGQMINLEINVKNESDQPVAEFSVSLIKQITYYTHANSSRQKGEVISITEQDTRGCDVSQEEIIRVNIEVPPIPPTDCSTSNIVKVKYSIRIIGSVACCHSNPVLDLPIIIGSYPIQDVTAVQTGNPYPNTVVDSFSPNNLILQQPSAPQPFEQNNYALPYPSAPCPFPNEDPPTYEDAIHSKDSDGSNFKPKYPMYKRTTSYSS